MTSKFEDARFWWEKYKVNYPFHAEMPNSVRCLEVSVMLYGEFASFLMAPGIRTWGFRTAQGRDDFCHDFGGTPL